MVGYCLLGLFFFQAEDGIRDLVRSRGLGDVYKRQILVSGSSEREIVDLQQGDYEEMDQLAIAKPLCKACLLYTSDAADERSSVDLGGRRIIKKKKERRSVTGRAQSTHNR